MRQNSKNHLRQNVCTVCC